MELLLRPAPDHRPAPLPVPTLPPGDPHPMLELLPGTPRSTPRADPPESDPAWQLARGVSHAIVEVLAGRRPATQLERWATHRVIGELALCARRRRGRAVRVASVRVQRPRPGVLEVSVRVEHAPARSGAIALRLVQRDQRWLCTVVELGPEFSLASRGTS